MLDTISDLLDKLLSSAKENTEETEATSTESNFRRRKNVSPTRAEEAKKHTTEKEYTTEQLEIVKKIKV